MKALLLLACAFASAFHLYAQGTVNFSGGPVYVGQIGGPLASAANGPWLASLYAGPAGAVPSSLVQIGGAPASINAGFISGGNVIVPGIPAASPASFQIRAWHSSLGASWGASGGQLDGSTPGTGLSIVITVVLGGPGPTPDLGAAFPMVVSPIPEPSSIALGLLGLGAVALIRRKRN